MAATDQQSWTAQQLTQVLLRALDRPSIVYGSLTLNFDEGKLLTYDVKEHFRAPKDLTPQRVDPLWPARQDTK